MNYVNAPLIARERGIEVREERSQSARDYTNLVRVEVGVGDEEIRVAGTTIGSDNRLWLVSALGFDLEIELAPLLVFFRYDDVPGVIGRVGTLFGAAGVNIANMTVSRSRRGGKALMVLSIDSRRRPRSSSTSAPTASTTPASSTWSRAVSRGPVARLGASGLRPRARREHRRAARGVPRGDEDRRRRGARGRLRPEEIVKSLVFMCDGRPVLALDPRRPAGRRQQGRRGGRRATRASRGPRRCSPRRASSREPSRRFRRPR